MLSSDMCKKYQQPNARNGSSAKTPTRRVQSKIENLFLTTFELWWWLFHFLSLPPADAETKFQPFRCRLGEGRELHNLLFHVSFRCRSRKSFRNFSTAPEMLLIESDSGANAMQLTARPSRKLFLPKRFSNVKLTFESNFPSQVHPRAAQVHPSEPHRDEDVSLPASQLHLHRPQLHGHAKPFAHTQWREVVHLHTAELRLSRTNNGTIEKVNCSEQNESRAADDAMISSSRLFSEINFFFIAWVLGTGSSIALIADEEFLFACRRVYRLIDQKVSWIVDRFKMSSNWLRLRNRLLVKLASD